MKSPRQMFFLCTSQQKQSPDTTRGQKSSSQRRGFVTGWTKAHSCSTADTCSAPILPVFISISLKLMEQTLQYHRKVESAERGVCRHFLDGLTDHRLFINVFSVAAMFNCYKFWTPLLLRGNFSHQVATSSGCIAYRSNIMAVTLTQSRTRRSILLCRGA